MAMKAGKSISNISTHGGDVYRNSVDIDFSVSLNPVALPEEVTDAAALGLREMHQYPDPLQQSLREAIAGCEGINPWNVICGSGASELIMAICHAFAPGRAVITAPCYSGYRRALAACGAAVQEHALDPSGGFRLDRGILDIITEDTDIVFIADPNNPDGKLIDAGLKKQIERHCEECGALLVIDECFLPLTERGLGRTDIEGRTLHLRAFTKTFAVPGIRLGYLISRDAGVLDRIAAHLPEWNVSRIAERIGEAAAAVLKGTDYLERSVRMIAEEREYLTSALRATGIEVFESDANYLLLRSRPDLYDRLLEQGILIRRCSDFSGLDDTFFRIAVRRHEDNERLADAVREIL